MKGLRRLIFWLVVLELVAAFAVATAIRIKFEQPARYIGSAFPASPHQLTEASTPILDAGQHEEQVA
jgi:hypothetical protein